MKTNNLEFSPTASLETLLTPEATALLSEIKNDIMAGMSSNGQIEGLRNSISHLTNSDHQSLGGDYKDTAYQDRYQDTAYDDHYKDNVAYRDGTQN